MLSKQATEEYKKIYKDQFGEEINDSEANNQGTKLLKLFKLISRPIPKNDMQKKMNVAVILFKDKYGKILLNHRKDNPPFVDDVWELIGGGVNENESPLEAIKREIKEELNYTVDELKDNLKLIKEFKISTDKYFANVHAFSVDFPGLEKFSDSDEVSISDLKLFTKPEALKLNLLPISKKVLETINI